MLGRCSNWLQRSEQEVASKQTQEGETVASFLSQNDLGFELYYNNVIGCEKDLFFGFRRELCQLAWLGQPCEISMVNMVHHWPRRGSIDAVKSAIHINS